MRRDVRRTVQSLALAVLALVGGVVFTRMGWFPAPLVERALLQALRLGEPPDYLTERIYQRDGLRIQGDVDLGKGMTMVAGAWPDASPRRGLRLIGRRGDVLHAWSVSTEDVTGGASDRVLGNGASPDDRSVHGFALLPGGDVVLNLDYVGTVRLDPCSEVVWRLTGGGHHSVEPTARGDFWIPTFRRRTDVRGLPGLHGPVVEDRMTRVSPRGEVLEHISVLDVLYENGLERYIPKGHPEVGYRIRVEDDVTHLNDIDPLPQRLADEYPLFEGGDLLVSLRKLSLVFVLDPATREVKWHASDPFIHQHDPDWIGDGWIGVFDNNDDETERGRMLGGSRIVAVETRTDSVEVLFPTVNSDPFYTDVQGDWQRLDDGHLLLTESQTGRVVEAGPSGETVWEWIAPPFDGDHVAEVTGARRYDVTPEQVADWRCPSSGASPAARRDSSDGEEAGAQ